MKVIKGVLFLIVTFILESVVLFITNIIEVLLEYDNAELKQELFVNQLKKMSIFQIVDLFKEKNMFFIICTIIVVVISIYFIFMNKDKDYVIESKYAVHGSSRWATFDEIIRKKELISSNAKKIYKDLLKSYDRKNNKYLKSNGIILGKKDKKVVVQPINSKLPNRNVFIVGGPGSSKTQAYVVTNVLHEKECTLIITDPKGEVYEMTSEIKRKQGYEVHVINFDKMMYSDRYNPLDYVRTDNDAAIVADAIVASKNDPSKKDIWYLSQMLFLKALILYVKDESCTKYKKNMSGVLEILQYNTTEESKDTGISDMDKLFYNIPPTHPARMAYELGLKKSAGETRASIMASLVATVGDYVDKTVSDFSSESTFLFSDLGKRKIALYVIIPTMKQTWEGLINLMFTQIFQELYDVGSENNCKLYIPVLFILDEFPNLGKFDNFETFLATARGYGIGCTTILQNITQLQAKYGKERAESIVGNCAIKICLGNVNETTSEYFSKLMGSSTVRVETSSNSYSKGKTDSSSNSESINYSRRNLMNADELLTMDKNNLIVIISGKYPIMLEKPYQYILFKKESNKYRENQTDYKCLLSNNNVEEDYNKQENFDDKKDYDKQEDFDEEKDFNFDDFFN